VPYTYLIYLALTNYARHPTDRPILVCRRFFITDFRSIAYSCSAMELGIAARTVSGCSGYATVGTASCCSSTALDDDEEMSSDRFPSRRESVLNLALGPEPKQKVMVIGNGDFGQLGLGASISEVDELTLVDHPGLGDVVLVRAGGLATICLTRVGEVLLFSMLIVNVESTGFNMIFLLVE